jgi:4-amino-4-deoxy-L-arabinose transferase-like glycosyltransferase
MRNNVPQRVPDILTLFIYNMAHPGRSQDRGLMSRSVASREDGPIPPALKIRFSFIAFALIVYIAGLHVKIMEGDAAEYASMSRQIFASKHFWMALLQPPGYLDKPPLLFFLAALSFKLFGVSTVSYKIPAFLITLLGFYSTYRLGKRLYDGRTGLLAASLLCSCQAFIFFTNDVRTDAILAGTAVFALWQIVEFLYTSRARHFILGFVGIALAMLAKGPIGCMVPALAIGSYIAGKRDYKMYLKWYWIAGAAIVLILLLPMLWGLQQQYGWRGVKFYFWTNSFGRLTGASSWRDHSGYFFFAHTFLWAFFPWMLLACYGIGAHVIQAARRRFDPACAKELLLLGGVLFPFIALSCSHYKLPHYVFVIFPQVAILTAKTIYEIVDAPGEAKACQAFSRIQSVCCVAGWAFALACMTVVFPCKNIAIWLLALLALCATVYFALPKHAPLDRLILPSLAMILGVNLMLNLHFFPQLLAFQGGSTAAASICRNHAPVDRLYAYRIKNDAIDFYTQSIVPLLDHEQLQGKLSSADAWIYTDDDGYRAIAQMGYRPLVVDSFPDFHVTRVNARFLYFKTRPAALRAQYLLFIPGPTLS